MLSSRLVAAVAGVSHGLTTRAFGAIGPRTSPDARARRAAAVRAIGGDPAALVTPHQVHGARVATVDASHAGRTLEACDGLITLQRGLPLLVQGADCPLVLLTTEAGDALAVVHSGWRGTVQRIVAVAVAGLAALDRAPPTLRAAVFPGIGPCCFEVGAEVIAAFEDCFGRGVDGWHQASARVDRRMLDLGAALRATLLEAGLRAESVDVVPGCTACGGLLWSHRASGGGPERHGLFGMLTI